MKVRFSSALVILTTFLCSGVASPAGKLSSFKGRIAAYRPADRLQVGSFVFNKELLLFQADGTSHELLKLVYVHPGYSDLKDGVISGAQHISIFVHRDRSCDQNLGSFEKGAPAIPIEGDGRRAFMIPIVFAASVSLPPESYRMKCYVLERWSDL